MITDYKQMVEDSIWYKIYRYYNSAFVRPAGSQAIQVVSENLGVRPQAIAFFDFVYQNFDLSRFSSSHFFTRYPFANRTAIKKDIEELVVLGLLKQINSEYSVTEKGEGVGFELQKALMLEEELNSQLEDVNHLNVIALFEDVSRKSASPLYLGMNSSLDKRVGSSARHNKIGGNIHRLNLAFGDLVALRNDQSHYRLELLKRVEPAYRRYELSPAAIEIMSYAYEKNFNPGQVMSRSTWGHDLEETIGFMSELVDNDLAEWVVDEISLTTEGRKLQLRSAEHCEQLFYSPWLPMRLVDYDKLKATIN